MPSLTDHPSLDLVKILCLGDAGSGKTGGLTSLVKAGYNLRIYDFDNLLGSLVQYVRRECPENLGNVAYQTFTDKMKGIDSPIMMAGASVKVMPFLDGTPKAFSTALKQLTRWKTETEDWGDPGTWGKDTFVVIDSLTSMASAAFRFAQAMNPAARDAQTYYFTAQQLLLNTLQLLCSEQFATNVIVLAHVAYDQNQLQITKGFPRSIGSALNQQIGAYFNCVLLVESQNNKRIIKTDSTGIVDLKNPVAFRTAKEYPLSTGLADFVSAVTSKEN
jgi:AAA domain